MLIIEDVLLEEYGRLLRIISAIEKEQSDLPKGSIQIKRIHGVNCHYLQFREGSKVKSKYINNNDVEQYRDLISKRKHNDERLSELRKNLKLIEKAIGKDLIDEHTTKGVY